jgi:hypothetical protein
MKYVMLIYNGSTPTPDDPEAWATLSEAEQQAMYRDYQALQKTPGFQPNGTPMAGADMATTVRVQDGELMTTDGPFVELKDTIAGLFVLEADDLDAAIAVAAKIPQARMGGGVEIRPERTAS